MWECSSDGHGDGIYFLASSDSGKDWTDYGEVIRSSMYRSDYLDYAHACDPSVIWDGTYFYIFYTGAPDWGAGSCNTSQYGLAEGSCDNRIFVARAPASSIGSKASYQKLVDVGECASPSCFQYQSFWGDGSQYDGTQDVYPPVPIIRNEIAPVWRRIGTGSSGHTTQQTDDYGIGQPSALNVWAIRLWYTWQNRDSYNGTPYKDAEWVQWDTNYNDLSNPWNLVNNTTWASTQRVSNINDVDYSVAFDSSRNRYIAAIGRSPYQPCVNYAIKTGYDTTIPAGADPNNPDATNNEIITRNLLGDINPGSDGTDGCLAYAGAYSDNVGLLRDLNGYLVTASDPSGNQVYWVYYSDNSNQISSDWHIARVPFTVN
jgi:hypothetical protein